MHRTGLFRWFGSDLIEARPEYVLDAERDGTIVHHIAEGAALLARSEGSRTVESLRRSLEWS
jgi:hypothetical protein